ncbi:MAG: hypothetical protein PVG27_02245 [Chloroflexota bacterium]|jgi:hypothetical protein
MVAGVIVALFGGLLAAGMFTVQRSDVVPPAAVSAPPTTEATSEATEAPTTSVRTDILPGVALTVAEVEPGVYRVVNDGVRDLILGGNTDIVAGHDGGIWLLRKNQFVPVGGEGYGWGTEKPVYVGDFEVPPDGTVWVQADGAIQSFDGKGWTTHHEVLGGVTVEVTPDSRVWATCHRGWRRATGRPYRDDRGPASRPGRGTRGLVARSPAPGPAASGAGGH